MKDGLEFLGIFILCMFVILLFFAGVFASHQKLLDLENDLALLRAQINVSNNSGSDNIERILKTEGRIDWLLRENADLRARIEDLDPTARFKPTGGPK